MFREVVEAGLNLELALRITTDIISLFRYISCPAFMQFETRAKADTLGLPPHLPQWSELLGNSDIKDIKQKGFDLGLYLG